jgi:GMP synthase (glutamine-hydrolysing)
MDKMPVLGICYGAQLMANNLGGTVQASNTREYGRAQLVVADSSNPLLAGLNAQSQVWMSHGDTITALPTGASLIGSTESVAVAAFQFDNKPVFGIQFHPEVTHSTEGKTLIKNFVIDISQCVPNWTPANFVTDTVARLKQQLGSDKVVLGLSGGVDSSVAALLLHKAIGTNLYCIFVDNGLLRQNEFSEVLESYKSLGLNVKGVDSAQLFYDALAGLTDPEAKREAIGKAFIDVFDQEAKAIADVKWLGQGTIYPDVIESVSVAGPSVTIKSHHNVGGLPEKMNLKVRKGES